ncbi:ABC transporter permease [Paenibacillus psychroresistens]|uniref:ABC transporter permease n=1 Tax=Paenibacillus psychroresistens TaxID=1778678 RepID=A0A6B8RSU8_9BACL|nr:ABC transporter permease subunit [Paenibacillus psychroresistens]QGQ99521.1 ABC transporter permease [Paenibacillus psychroresistens]
MITIVMMTWKEMLRKRVMTLSLVMSAVFLIAFWFVARAIGKDMTYGIGALDQNSIAVLLGRFQQGAMTLSLGFFFGSFVIAFLAIFSSVAVVAGEAEQGVLQALLPRPLARWRWFLGRWLGYVSLGIIYAALLFGSILAITQAHSTVPGDFISLTKSFVLFAFVVPLLVSVAMLGSCFFSALGNGVFMVMLFGAGWLGGMIEKVSSIGIVSEDTFKPLQTISGLMSIVMPVDSLQRRMLAEMFSLKDLQGLTGADDFLGFFGLNQIPSNTFLVYAVCYTLFALLLGMFIFRRKDL